MGAAGLLSLIARSLLASGLPYGNVIESAQISRAAIAEPDNLLARIIHKRGRISFNPLI
jgi:hypothetical protein